MAEESPKAVKPEGEPQKLTNGGDADKVGSGSAPPEGDMNKPVSEPVPQTVGGRSIPPSRAVATSAAGGAGGTDRGTRSPESPAPPQEGPSEQPARVASSPDTNRWGVLVEEEIKRHELIVQDPQYEDPRCYQRASYDLRLGDEYVTLDAGDRREQLKISSCRNDGIITINPFASAIVSTYESLRLPNNVVGRFDLRIRHALEGLVVQMGTQVEPAYSGKLFALLHNISDRPKSLKFRDYDDRLFTIEFSYTSQPSEPTKPPKIVKSTFRDILPTNCARAGIDGTIETIKKVQERVEELSKDFSIKKMMVFTGVTLFVIVSIISFVIPFALKTFTYDKDYFPVVDAQAISAMKEEAIAQKVLRVIEARPSAGGVSSSDRLNLELLELLKARRHALKGDPSKSEELNIIQKEINKLVDQLKR